MPVLVFDYLLESGVQFVQDLSSLHNLTDVDHIKIFLAWSHTVAGDVQSSKFHRISCKDKLGRVEGDSVLSTEVEPVYSLVKALVYVVRHVINAFCPFGDIGNNLVELSGTSIT